MIAMSKDLDEPLIVLRPEEDDNSDGMVSFNFMASEQYVPSTHLEDIAVFMYSDQIRTKIVWYAYRDVIYLHTEIYEGEEEKHSIDYWLSYIQDEWRKHRCAKYSLSMHGMRDA